MKMKSIMKKLFCVILSLVVIVAGIPFTALALPADEIDFAILSDIHYFAESSMGYTDADKQEFNEIMLMNNSTSGLAPYLTDAAMANITAMALRGEIEFLLLPGDLTRNAEKAAHLELADRLAEFEAQTGVPVYVIVGNHDVNNQRAMFYDGNELVSVKKNPELRSDLDTTPEEFEEIYKDFGYSAEGGYYSRYKAKADNSEGSLSYAIDVSDNYRLIAIDSQLYSADNTDSGENEQETAGHISDALLEWTVNECKKAEADGKTILGMCHTNFVPHFETEVDLFDNFVLRGWEKVADTLADAGMNFCVSGHVHMQDVATYVNDNGETIADITTTSILSYPNQFRTVNMQTALNGDITMNYNTHDVDEYTPVMINGVAQPKPFKYQTWAYNFGGADIKDFVLNVLEYQLRYGFGKDVKDAGGLYFYLDDLVGISTILDGITGYEVFDTIGNTALSAIVYSLCHQLDRKLLTDVNKTLDILSPILDKLLDIKVSDERCTMFANTLGFQSKYDYGTLGDLASTVLAYHTTNNEDPNSDKFLQSALARFYNGENAETIVNTLLDVVLNDLLQDVILDSLNIDFISFGTNLGPTLIPDMNLDIYKLITGEDWEGFGIDDVISLILMTGVAGGDTLSDVVYSLLDEYLTQSQYDIIDGEFYRIMKDLTHDETPEYMADLDGSVTYAGKVAVPLSQNNLRLPSHIAVTFGEDTSTSVNISYFTKYSITDSDIQIVPYSKNPDFSKGSTVKANIKTNCEVDAEREYASIDLGFIGILYHKVEVNRHTIEIKGLEAGKQYCYRIGDADRGWWSDTGVISTADNGSTYSFFHVTDPQSVTEKQYTEDWAATLNTAFKHHNADFILSTGDMVDNGNDFVEWKRMFNLASDSLMNTVLMTASGNHEARGDNAQIQNFVYSNLPEQDATTGVYYSFDYNTAHVAVLNTNNLNEDGTLSNDQFEWLKADMNASDKTWKFVALHKAPYSNGSHFDDDDVSALRSQLQGLMPELDIDIVFQGHDHVYMRTDVMKNNAVVKADTETLTYNGLEYTAKLNPDGTIYSINGTAGSKHYEPKADSETANTFPKGEAVVSLDVPSYSYIQIDGNNLYFDSYSVENGTETRIDSFAISKDTAPEDNNGGDAPSGEGNTNNGNGSNNEGENNGLGDVIDDITDTFRQNPVMFFVAIAIVSLVAISAIAVTIIVKRKREEI